MKRFSPAEAYGGTVYKVKQEKLKKNQLVPTAQASRPSPVYTGNRVPASSNVDPAVASPPDSSSPPQPPPPPPVRPPPPPPPPASDDNIDPTKGYIPPPLSELYKFPPNNNYVASVKPTKDTQPITSYLPPAAGPADSSEFVGPVNPDYLPPTPAKETDSLDSVKEAMAMNDQSEEQPPPNHDHTHDPHDHSHDHDHNHEHILDFDPNDHIHNHDHHHDPSHDHYFDHHHYDHYHSPPPGYSEESPTAGPPAPPPSPPAPEDPSPSPPQPEEPPVGPPEGHNFNGLYGIDASPELTYDFDPHDHDHHFDHHDFDHHHFDHHHFEPPPPPPPPTTTPEPEEPDEPEPRVKKYSYYYLGRKLWYIPLYFTVWFTFYITVLILKSIARHKIQAPNHWQTRRRRAIIEEPHAETVRKVDKMTTFILKQIGDFEEKQNENVD